MSRSKSDGGEPLPVASGAGAVTLAEPHTPALRVYLADDHPIVLAGVKALVTAEPGLGSRRRGRRRPHRPAGSHRIEAGYPDPRHLDAGAQRRQGGGALRPACPACKILILTVHEDRGYVRQLLELGVAGYLLKRSAAGELVRAISAIAAGGIYLDPAIAGIAVSASASHLSSELNAAELSKREIDVARLAASGHSNKSVAAELGISIKSVETYKARAMEKLGFRTRVELVRFAISSGWLVA